MKLFSEIKRESRALSSGSALIGAGAAVLLILVTVISTGRFYVYAFLCKPKHSPPAFVFYLFFILIASLIGYAAGISLSQPCKEKRRYGTVLFCGLALLFLILWYVTFFAALSFLFALFLLLCALLPLAFAIREAWEQGVLPTAFLAVSAAGLLYYVWFNISVILLN